MNSTNPTLSLGIGSTVRLRNFAGGLTFVQALGQALALNAVTYLEHCRRYALEATR
jgi:hypothetical protein